MEGRIYREQDQPQTKEEKARDQESCHRLKPAADSGQRRTGRFGFRAVRSYACRAKYAALVFRDAFSAKEPAAGWTARGGFAQGVIEAALRNQSRHNVTHRQESLAAIPPRQRRAKPR